MRYRFLSNKAVGFSAICGSLLVLLVVSSCYKEPDFPTQPEIEFKDISKSIRIDQFTGANKDSVVVSLVFRDGDGDLGMNSTEIANAEKTSDFNYVVRVFRRQRGQFVEFQPFLPYSGFFPRLKTDDKIGPIEGTLSYSIDFFHPFTPKRDSIQFQIYIKDRAGNTSNTVETKTIVLNEF